MESAYSSRIIRAGALVDDTKAFLVGWDEELSIEANLKRFQHLNLLGKGSRSRVDAVLKAFRRRYLTDNHTIGALSHLVKMGIPSDTLNRILYFYVVQSDRLLHDIVTEILLNYHLRGRQRVDVSDLHLIIMDWVAEGRTSGEWSSSTALRVVQGAVSTLRDFGILQGSANKYLGPIFLPVEAFAYIAMYLKQQGLSGERLLHHPEWNLFFMEHQMVEQYFLEAHQRGLLEYYAAGSVVRVEFPAQDIQEYAHVIVQRAL